MSKRLVVALLALCAQPAEAERLDDKFSFQLSGYFPSIDSKARIDSAAGTIGTGIDFERDLGAASHKALPAFKAEWRPDDDWMLNAEFYRVGRRQTRILERDIVVGDTSYPIQTTINSGFDSDIYRFTIGNRFYQTRNFEIGAAVGMHGTNFKVFLEGSGIVNGRPSSFRSEARSVFAPLPTLGLFATWQPARKLSVEARVDYLSLTIDKYNGRLVNAEVTAAYRVQKNIDLGVMYRRVDYRVRVRRDKFEGQVEYQFNGPAMFVQLGF